MSKIKLLDSQLTNMIAAGEVVERPMGIVKELVENSIDANSKNIIVRVKDGGIKSIQVIDDGDGMDEKDALLAFERHATSKIFKPRDLFAINTFGFRGEALPSIASVSKVTLITNGTKVEINQGEKTFVGPYPSNKGTDITVEELFHKTPARLKHLKSPNYENSLINDVIMKFALSNPHISFTYINNDRESFKSSGNNDLLEVIYKVYGKDIAKNAIKIDEEDFDYKLKGYMIQPQFTRATRYSVNIFMNGRMVRPYKIQKAAIDAYHQFIPKDRYPIMVLDIIMDTQIIDVNVHPSKWEVRLSKQQQLENLIKDRLSKLLSKKIVPFSIDVGPKKKETVEKIETISLLDDYKYEPILEKIDVIKEEIKPIQEVIKEEVIQEEIKQVETFPSLRVIGQFHGKFILAEGEKGLYVIDQHAAQERVHFEEVSRMMQESKNNFDLLVPVMIHVSLDVIDRLDELNELVKDLNIKFEHFGSDSLIVHSLPVWLKEVDEKGFLQDLVDYFKSEKEIDKLKMFRNKLATIACHRSIRFNRVLSSLEMQKVVDDLKACNQPFQCPHGRPTFVLIETYYLEREFLR